MFDAIVVGARCAGSPTAMLLAKQGYRVLLLDKARFPSDTMSTHWLQQPGVDSLRRWGLLDSLRATNCPPLKKTVMDFGAVVLTGSPPATPSGVKDGYCPRRKYLDNILVEAAVGAGSEFREAFAVTQLVWDGDRVVGVKGRVQDGREIEERARIVVGADGMRSQVAGWVNAPETHRYDGPTTPCYYNYYADFPIDQDTVEIIVRDGWGAGLLPTNDNLTCMIVGFKAELFPDFRSDPGATLEKVIKQDPHWGARLAKSKRVEKAQGILALPAFYRRPYGPGWALVGDAGYWRHPITAQGITDCFRDAELLAEAIGDGFAGRSPLEDAMIAYETKRDQSTKAMYDSTNERSMLEPLPPNVVQLLHALDGNQEAIDQFMGVDAGTVRPQDFFSPANMGSIFAQAAQKKPSAQQGAAPP
jgi:flavin-dependent dehydrogenase